MEIVEGVLQVLVMRLLLLRRIWLTIIERHSFITNSDGGRVENV